ncbi:phosphoglucosamine mutase [Alkaliphilus metalliredigens QYMF]|uniref:Phosphoglucosamine mutase n=1 Tax=Alkaliphilus metalliredigens (strain QYMF) TaxID=293826 RepID=GLMM_ALKMQ|nr:phosphoglucosamine mutase [Alkaliphilus metalliredigens]A6TW06.1 RecName: Full=Phosphoglucosamine mutase [Alkaliphilus metalliredigens QYMF]ABR50374.1 phosphoglucosamine mutase [Alkaliphilus metalliredigens QYMF]
MGKLFGTDGIRGIANEELTPELAYQLGRVGAYVLIKGAKDAKVVIGRDTRISGDLLTSAITSGFLSMGVDVIDLGVIPTPAVAYLTRELQGNCGIVISASHNPAEYNGIKFFNHQGYKLPDEIEEQIETYILNNEEIENRVTGAAVGKRIELKEATRLYMDYLKTTIECRFEGLKIAMDLGNGAVYEAAPQLLKELGAEVIIVNDQPDGMNINEGCGSTHPEVVQRLVKENKADVGLSFDGDADRLIAVDNTGAIVDGDSMMAICGTNLNEKHILNKNTIVATVMSNIGLDLAMKEQGCQVVKTKVGDRYVLEEMIKEGYTLGGEQSGHIIFLKYNTTGDGLLTALQLIATVKESGKTLSELSGMMTSYPQVLVNAKVKNENKLAYMEDEVIMGEIKMIEEKMNGVGRVLIRPSGTEPLVRVMLEGQEQAELEVLAHGLAQLIESKLG